MLTIRNYDNKTAINKALENANKEAEFMQNIVNAFKEIYKDDIYRSKNPTIWDDIINSFKLFDPLCYILDQMWEDIEEAHNFNYYTQSCVLDDIVSLQLIHDMLKCKGILDIENKEFNLIKRYLK